MPIFNRNLHKIAQDLDDKGMAALQQYRTNGKVADLNRAVECWHAALKLTPSNSPDRPVRLNNLGAGLRNRYSRTGKLADLEDAIAAFEQAVQATPPNSLDRPVRLGDLGRGLFERYTLTRDLVDLDAAIAAFEQAVQATPPNSPQWPTRLNNLGLGLRIRYLHTGELADLQAAITAFEQAVQVTPSNSPDWPARLGDLGIGLRQRYDRTGKPADLDAAITALEQAIQASPPNTPDRPEWLDNLGLGLRDRYLRSGNLADLQAAIAAFDQAIHATPSNSPRWPTYLNNLGVGLRERYDRTGKLADLEDGIIAFEQAVQVTPSNSPDRPRWLNNLGIGLNERYSRTGNQADLDAAITAYQQGIQATSSDSPDRPTLLHNLGAGLRDRYLRTGNLADLEDAITAFDQAVQATPSDSLGRPGSLSNLGSGLRDRYLHSGNPADLDAAITAYQQAVQATPSDSSKLPQWLNNLGLGLRDRYFCTRDLADLQAALAAWEKSWSITQSRFAALSVAYQLGQQRQGTVIAAKLVEAYLEQAKRRDPRSANVSPRVLEIAEGNKSRLLTQLVGRSPLPTPSALSSEIAARELQLLADLTALDMQELASHDHLVPMQGETNQLQRLQQRQAALLGLEDLWARIAHLGPEGTAYVALRRGAVPTWQELSGLAKALGPATALLSFFMTTDQALLFLLRADWAAPRVVEVPLNQTGSVDLLARFFREVHGYRPGLRRGETWDYPLRPLFTKAQLHLEGVERLILAPAGIGHYLSWGVLAERIGWRASTGQALPLVTLPALGILPRLRQRPHVPPGPALVIGNPRGDLDDAEVEANAVAERFRTKPLLGAAATKSAVLARLSEATLIHLATHAFFDLDNPLDSGIVLADGVLTARDILQHRLQADLLVLSACESGMVGSLGGEELAGLSQVFLQTGIRSLLVSLWQVNDPATSALIQAFYIARQAGADKALALRQAMTQIQQDPRWAHPYYWGAFILVGDWE